MRERDIIRTYDDLLAALRAKRIERGLSSIELDDLSGMQDGYTGKLENGFVHNRKKSARSFGPVTLGLWLQALNIGLVIVDTNERGCARSNKPRDPAICNKPGGMARAAGRSEAEVKKWARRAGKVRVLKMSAAQRSASARHAIKARWAKRELLSADISSAPVE
jgi:hypothetical protein